MAALTFFDSTTIWLQITKVFRKVLEDLVPPNTLLLEKKQLTNFTLPDCQIDSPIAQIDSPIAQIGFPITK